MRVEYDVPRETVASLFDVSENTITNWVNAWNKSHPSDETSDFRTPPRTLP